jgi:cytidylate kinase
MSRSDGDKFVVVAIDGPAASGKSSTAEWVARELGFCHVDSGALYRAATAAALRTGSPPEEWTPTIVLEAARIVSLSAEGTSLAPLLDGAPADDEIRSAAVTNAVPRVARMQSVRSWVNEQVRRVATERNVVADGRDIGTAVFPDANVKIYLVADPWERAKRRLVQHLKRLPTDEEIAAETDRLVHRDAADTTQLVQARDAVLIDTTHLLQSEQVARIVALAKAATRSNPYRV